MHGIITYTHYPLTGLTTPKCLRYNEVLSLICLKLVIFIKFFTNLQREPKVRFSDKKSPKNGTLFQTLRQWSTEPGKYRAYQTELAQYYYRAKASNTEPSRAEPHGMFMLILTSKTFLLVI